MPGAVADNTGNSPGRTGFVSGRWRRLIFRGCHIDARVIVVENKDLLVIRIRFTAYAVVAGAQITVGNIAGQNSMLAAYGFAAPRPVLPMCCDNHPFLAQGMPAFFPSHKILPDKTEISN